MNDKNLNIRSNKHAVWFHEFPEHPIFKRSMIHTEIWKHTGLNSQLIINEFKSSGKFLNSQYCLLKMEYKGMSSMNSRKIHRAKMEEERIENIKIINQLLSKRSTDIYIDSALAQLHIELYKNKDLYESSIFKYKKASQYKFLEIADNYGYRIDMCSGEILTL